MTLLCVNMGGGDGDSVLDFDAQGRDVNSIDLIKKINKGKYDFENEPPGFFSFNKLNKLSYWC